MEPTTTNEQEQKDLEQAFAQDAAVEAQILAAEGGEPGQTVEEPADELIRVEAVLLEPAAEPESEPEPEAIPEVRATKFVVQTLKGEELEVLRLDENGGIYVHGELATVNKDVVVGLEDFLRLGALNSKELGAIASALNATVRGEEKRNLAKALVHFARGQQGMSIDQALSMLDALKLRGYYQA